MFNFFQKRSKQDVKDFSFLEVDMHSHILPGIDDGSKNVEESLFLISELSNLGYKEFIATPHIHSEYYPNTRATIQEALQTLKQAMVEKGMEIQLSASAEYFLDEHFEKLLESDDLLPFRENFLLVEQSFFAETPGINEILFKIQTKGYQPILAHPERYTYWANQFERYENLNEQGVLFQVNLMSLVGHYGKTAQKTAKKLIENDMVNFLGTDLHNASHISKLKSVLADKRVMKILDRNWQNSALNSCTTNV